jgi:hypothetical protein
MNSQKSCLALALISTFALAAAAPAQTPSQTPQPAPGQPGPAARPAPRIQEPGPPPADTKIVSLPFIEDFEKGVLDTNIWDMRFHGGATGKIVQDKVAHGKNAYMIHYPAGRGEYGFIAARLPESVHDHLYGRAYIYVASLPPAHSVLLLAGTRGFPVSNFLEVGESRGQFQPSFQQNGAGVPRGETTARQGEIPMGRWFCLEWEFTDKPDRIVLLVDGQPSVDKSFSFKGVDSELVKGFSEFDFGFRSWGNGTQADLDVYYDDIEISDKPIGQLTPVPPPAASTAPGN